jgi:hypothetical protein
MDEGNRRVLLHKDSRCAVQVGENGSLIVHLDFMADWVTEIGFALLIAKELSIDFQSISIKSHSSNLPKPDELNLFVHELKIICLNIKKALISGPILEERQKVGLGIQRLNQ